MKSHIIIILWLIALFWVVFDLLAKYKYKTLTGYISELRIKFKLKKLPLDYLILNDVYIQSNDKPIQIDHIVFSKYGIFIIETKCWSNKLVGNENDIHLKLIRKFHKPKMVYNPFIQNENHKKALMNILNLQEDKIIPLVCLLTQNQPDINSDKLVRSFTLIDKILSKREVILENYIELYDKFNLLKRTDKKFKRYHKYYVKKTSLEFKEKYKNKCPLCGGDLIVRINKLDNSEFYGCSNYPKCTFTKKKD